MDVLALISGYGQALVSALPLMAGLAALFTALSLVAGRCNRQGPWWRNPGIPVDLCYWFALPLVGSLFRTGFLVCGATYLFGIRTPEAMEAFLSRGHGPLADLPLPLQVAFYLVLSDLMLYWTHRTFHGRVLWRYHAIHHSSTEIDWFSAVRFHPVNVALHASLVDAVLLLAGVPPGVLVLLAPFNVAMSALVHANLDWSFGPFRYVLASPVFHRWHHTDPGRGGQKNFSATFPVFDLLFGTFHMPKGELPDGFGVDDEFLPESFLAQLLYPFRGAIRGSAFAPADGPAPTGPAA